MGIMIDLTNNRKRYKTGVCHFCDHCRYPAAYAVEDKLDKERTVFADTFDALRMNLQFFRIVNYYD